MFGTCAKGSHYEAGFKYGSILFKHNINPINKIKISKERKNFSEKCIPIYKEFFPEIIEEIKGMSDGLKYKDYREIADFLFTIYAFTFENKCSSFALKTYDDIILGKNSDFLKSIKKYCDSVYYKLNNSYSFIGNTTAFIEMEDGINENGLACALTFVYPVNINYGLNAGMLIRYILEKCRDIDEALNFLKEVPISSSQNIILADKNSNIALVECNCNKKHIIKNDYLFITNHFVSKEMIKYNTKLKDDVYSHERYTTLKNAFINNKYNLDFSKDLLSGKYGFLCQYNNEIDTVWSSIYSIKNKKIYRAEGNPSRKKYEEDKRLKFNY